MPYVDYKTPIESKINWVQGISFVIQALALALNHEWVVANPRATLIIGMVINALTAILRTFFPTASTTWAIKAAVLLALTLGLSASPAAACAPGDIAISKAEGEEITREIQGQEVARLVAEAITDPKQYTEAVARERFPGMTNEWYTAHVNTERKAITWRGMTFDEQKALAPDWWEKRLIKERDDQAEEADEFGGGIGGRILEAWAEYDAIHGKGAAQKSFEDQLRRDGLIVGSNVRQVTRATPEQLPPVHKMPLPRTMKIVIRFVFGD